MFSRLKSVNAKDWASNLVGFLGPTVLLTCICALLLTDSKLPTWKLSWVNKLFAKIRRHRTSDADYGHDITKKNQFAIGDTDFNFQSMWLIVIPMIVGCFGYIPVSVNYADMAAEEEGKNAMLLRWEATSYLFGWASVMCLVWFLIPVSRHSVLLVAMGWSPIHALRIHIWAGYLSFIYMFLHGIILVGVWFTYYDYPVWQQIIPAKQCWTWHPDNNEIEPPCDHVYWNLTGIVAAIFFIVLWGTSLNWVRRRNYRLFYWSHIICGTMLLLTTVLHMQFYAIYLLCSSTYYLASTMPTLVQALASRYRGGVKICKVTTIPDSGGCVEVHVETNKFANAELDKEPCLFVKLCVPTISLIWHPFTVYKHQSDPCTVRFLFRPVGPFTKKLAELITSPLRPVTIMDGFYRGADRAEQALQHDCVTIVTGGVAITPFLSMIPSLLAKIHRSDGLNVNTKKVILHWACREEGLADFVVQRYLNTAMEYAKLISSKDFRFEVKIYSTGIVAKALDETGQCDNSSSDTQDDLKMNECVEDSEVMVSSGTMESIRVNDDIETSVDVASSTTEEKVMIEDHEESSTPQAPGGGHLMELGRMMPGRYSSILWNVPLFLAITIPTWLMYWYVFSNYEVKDTWSYHDLIQMTWTTVYSGLFFVAFAFFVEGVVLVFRKYLPEPKLDDFEVDEFALKEECAVLSSGDNVTIEFLKGRPSAEVIFEAARLAEAPGIFMCGPAAMTSAVRREASKENSFLGLTRYALYDEPFEM